MFSLISRFLPPRPGPRECGKISSEGPIEKHDLVQIVPESHMDYDLRPVVVDRVQFGVLWGRQIQANGGHRDITGVPISDVRRVGRLIWEMNGAPVA